MKPARLAAFALALTATGGTTALAASASGSPALAMAAVIAPYSPDLSPRDKVTVAALFDGETGKVAAKKIAVIAEKIMCRTSNVDLTSRSCELTFKGGKHSLTGREANELFATMALAAILSGGADGSNIRCASEPNSTIDVSANKQDFDAGSSSSFDTGD